MHEVVPVDVQAPTRDLDKQWEMMRASHQVLVFGSGSKSPRCGPARFGVKQVYVLFRSPALSATVRVRVTFEVKPCLFETKVSLSTKTTATELAGQPALSETVVGLRYRICSGFCDVGGPKSKTSCSV